MNAEMSQEDTKSARCREATLQGPRDASVPPVQNRRVFPGCERYFCRNHLPDVPFVSGVKTVLDIGANVGAASVYFAMSLSRSAGVCLRTGKRCAVAAATECGAIAQRNGLSFRPLLPRTDAVFVSRQKRQRGIVRVFQHPYHWRERADPTGDASRVSVRAGYRERSIF